MANETLQLKHLTVLVGPQATGKSIFLQFLKLLLDTDPISRTRVKHELDSLPTSRLMTTKPFRPPRGAL
jgi:predicted ATPase